MNTKTAQKSTKRKNEKKDNVTYSNVQELVKTSIFGVGITNAKTENILEYMREIIQNSSENIYVVTPNPEMLVYAAHHKDFRNILNQAQISLCDGVGLYKAAQFLGKPLKERIIGTNFMEKVCEKANDWPITVGFLGGGPGVAEKAAECLLGRFPNLKIAFVAQEWSEEGFALAAKRFPRIDSGFSQNGNDKIGDNRIRNQRKSVDILFVALGVPKQESWMAEHLNKIPVRVMVGVGGAFDQIVDTSLRPPTWIHSLGLGWLYRLIREPWRLKRQLKLIEFMGMVVREKLRS